MSYLRSQIQVAVDQQHGVALVPQGQREEAVAVLLEELLQQKLRRGRQERVLAVRSADVLGGHDRHRAVRHLRGEGQASATDSHWSRDVLPGFPGCVGTQAEWPCHGRLLGLIQGGHVTTDPCDQ